MKIKARLRQSKGKTTAARRWEGVTTTACAGISPEDASPALGPAVDALAGLEAVELLAAAACVCVSQSGVEVRRSGSTPPCGTPKVSRDPRDNLAHQRLLHHRNLGRILGARDCCVY